MTVKDSGTEFAASGTIQKIKFDICR